MSFLKLKVIYSIDQSLLETHVLCYFNIFTLQTWHACARKNLKIIILMSVVYLHSRSWWILKSGHCFVCFLSHHVLPTFLYFANITTCFECVQMSSLFILKFCFWKFGACIKLRCRLCIWNKELLYFLSTSDQRVNNKLIIVICKIWTQSWYRNKEVSTGFEPWQNYIVPYYQISFLTGYF